MATANLTVSAGVLLAPAFPFEVALDCIGCRRRVRTIVFHAIDVPGICMKTGHTFDGALRSLETEGSLVRASFTYAYLPIDDPKYPPRFEPGAPTWARIHVRLTCPRCNQASVESTQTNLVRPFRCFCDCGALLYDDVAPPLLSWSE